MAANSLNSVVSNLVRASMGASVSSSVTDEELDRHVQELILKEAKKKAEQYAERGVRAYLPEREDKQPRANKRFLSSIIRHTDDHNKAVLKSQSEAALEAKIDREEQERKERRARATEATEAERQRRRRGRSLHDNDSWDRKRDSGHRRKDQDRSERDCDSWDDERKRRRHRSRSRSPRRDDGEDRRRKGKERQRSEDGREEHRSHRRRRHRSKSRSLEKDKSYNGRRDWSSSREKDDAIEESPNKRMSKDRDKDNLPLQTSLRNSQEVEEDTPIASSSKPSRRPSPFNLSAQFESRKAKAASPPPPNSPTLSEEEDIERLRPRRRRRLSPRRDDTKPESPPTLSSRMDKYFEQSYDPRLDTGPMTLPEVPATGLIDGAEFESWEAMLDIIRQRREDKAERKRMERAGLLPRDDREKGSGSKSMTSTSEAWTMDAGPGLMDIKYSKRGTVREWDVGKEGF